MHSGRVFNSEPKPFMSSLTHLTSLELCCMRMSPEVLQHLESSLKVCLRAHPLGQGLSLQGASVWYLGTRDIACCGRLCAQ